MSRLTENVFGFYVKLEEILSLPAFFMSCT